MEVLKDEIAAEGSKEGAVPGDCEEWLWRGQNEPIKPFICVSSGVLACRL